MDSTLERPIAPTTPLFLQATLGVLAVTWALILARPWTPIWDQAALLGWTGYPTWDQEVVPRLIGGLLYTVGPHAPSLANALLRLISGALYLGAAALLTTRVLRRNLSRVALLVLLVAAGFPLLWLSSELITGALLCVAIWLALQPRHSWLLGMAIAALALTKPEMALASLAVGALYLRSTSNTWRGLLAGLMGLGIALTLPGIIIHRGAFFESRAWSAFGQHYSALVAPLQIGPHPDPWNDWQTYVAASFPGASSVGQVIIHHRTLYGYFVVLAIIKGLVNAWRGFGLALVAVGIRIALRRSAMQPVEKWLVASMIVLIPEVLLAFPHVRYMAKLAPMVLMVPLAEAESRDDVWRYVILGILALGGILLLVDRFQNPGQMPWFPD